jgi:glycine/D-amino acid oxidase-like deaminating enzyme/nitrite reductase/ring-hydroxylating ferredoxin subunit
MVLPGKPDCCWNATTPTTDYPTLSGSGRADIAVVGGGIVGLTTAYLLAHAGLSVSVLEARRIGRQVTGRSTAKITSQHGLIYRHLIGTLGIEHAQRYAEANRSGAQQICRWVDELGIACDLHPKDAYAYTCDPGQRADIAAEAEAARRVGFDAEVLDKAPLPFETAGALRFRDQAQFNPAQYLVGLALAVEAVGGRIFEDTRVTAVDPGNRWRVISKEGSLDVEHAVIATNFPITGPVEYDRSTQPRCHIAMAYRTTQEAAIDGMFIGIDQPTHSLRMGRDRDGLLLVVLGPACKTGQDGDIARRFRDLDSWVRTNLPVGEAEWRWVNEDYDTADRVPFVGAPSDDAPGFYIATGFNAWGISNGSAAGALIADQIRGRSNPWVTLYAPARPSPNDFNKGGDAQSSVASIEDIAPGQGGVIEIETQKVAIWKDDDGRAHAVSATCTHKGCTVTWNNAERTWDCLCHGSMFQADGGVIHGPAVEPLPHVDFPEAPDRSRF